MLLPGVGEALGSDSLVGTSSVDDLVDLLEDPIGGLKAVIGLVVSGMEARQLLEVLLHVLLLKMLGQRRHIVLLDALLGEGHGLFGGDVLSAEILGVGDVHEVLAILLGISKLFHSLWVSNTYATQLPLLLLSDPLCLAGRELNQKGLFSRLLENDVIGFNLLDKTSGDGGKARCQKRGLRKLHDCRQLKITMRISRRGNALRGEEEEEEELKMGKRRRMS